MSDTLFLAVSYIDRFLSLHAVQRSRLQLVGVACMLLAAKYEEIYAPQACRSLLLACSLAISPVQGTSWGSCIATQRQETSQLALHALRWQQQRAQAGGWDGCMCQDRVLSSRGARWRSLCTSRTAPTTARRSWPWRRPCWARCASS